VVPAPAPAAPVQEEERPVDLVSIGGGSSRVAVSMGPGTAPARGFSIGGGRSKFTFSFGR